MTKEIVYEANNRHLTLKQMNKTGAKIMELINIARLFFVLLEFWCVKQ
jgi:hypothetical protein